ncbi:hypothetical protein HH800_08835 [Sphingobium yanoikuyae]|uniref:L-serine ammonia-lyase n=1 Tax=Sphingobium yanoikuyae TaxID=13690 RepID=A0A6M4G5T7_SPHYA|nr:L-serine ammonia-lyase, iron-sulfur-dependent, subunit alpha [Sphingobium yanoikuyae]QJR02280.1 hypothetical protein HH800_08835 [Sphingobium yanoikuyae]
MDHLFCDPPRPARACSTRALGLTDLFAVGIGPSSSHTVGPMRAAWRFAEFLAHSYLRPARIECTLFGSLALTGRGHLSNVGVLLGLSGWTPDCVDPDEIANIVASARRGKCLALGGRQSVAFCESSDLRFDPHFLPEHLNGLRFIAWLPDGKTIEKRYFSIGGGTVIGEADEATARPVALAVNEENAAGGRVVTAPTNGAAGVLPAVIRYYRHFIAGADDRGARYMLYTAAAIGMLYKTNASISAAEMGCQGEVGVACSMAAAALAAAMGGSNAQIENAAEIGMEHNLGLTCDPIGGLVQIPCVERNTMGAIKAINAAYLALRGNGAHHVSLDAVIETMRQTGEDMKSQYKETSLGGLALNAAVC